MSESNTVKITVYGKEFTIKTSEDPRTTQEYAKFIDDKMREIGQKTGSFDPNRIATLALLQITHELFSAKRKSENDDSSDDLADIENRLDEALKQAGLE